jgi:glycosyltransferase involved in cell wall biosynthesis
MSDTGLPDARIERAAKTSLKLGHTLYFCGSVEVNSGADSVFSRMFGLKWTPKARLRTPFIWSNLRKHFSQILDELRPDVIHAHNVWAAKLASEFRYPFVFDDHECISLQLEAVFESTRPSKKKYLISNLIGKRIWPVWERELVQKTTTITVSETIAQDYRRVGNSVFVVPNFPAEDEIEKDIRLDLTNRILSSVYAGKETQSFVLPFRDISGFSELFYNHNIGTLSIVGMENSSAAYPIRYTGFLPRHKMYEEFSKHHIGILPWKNHWFHKYCNPNKVYEYAHSGLLVMLTDDFTTVTSVLDDHCISFANYDELVEKLIYYREHIEELNSARIETLSFARKNLFWEKFEHNIMTAYTQC